MPFTPSHALVALPFVRTPLVPAGIAVGAMTPDLPLFTRGVGLSYGFTHTLSNIVWTTLVAFVLLLVWRVVLRPGLVELAPNFLAARFPDEWRRTGAPAARELVAPREQFGYPLLLVISLLLGVLSHIAWDSFTHVGRWGVGILPILAQQWGPLAGYKWVQHGSSVLGIAILGVFALLWLRRREIVRRPRLLPAWVRWLWYLALPALLLAFWLWGMSQLGPLSETITVQYLAYRTLPIAAGVWGALTILLCVVAVLRIRAREASASS